MLLLVHRRPVYYPAFRLQLRRGLGARERWPGLFELEGERPLGDLLRYAGLRAVLAPVAEAPTPEALIEAVAALGLTHSEPFLIEHVALGRPDGRWSSERLAGHLARAIGGEVEFRNPGLRYLVVEHAEGYVIGRLLAQAQALGPDFRNRPVCSSAGLPPELAAAALNAVAIPGERIVDPTCGTGTVLYEASLRGMEALGFDLHWRQARAARINLAHFGVVPPTGVEHQASRGDARLVDFAADAVVANLP